MGGRGLFEDSARAHTRRPKWLRLGLMRLAFEDPWGRMLSWIGWPTNPSLSALPLCKISWQSKLCAATSDNFSF